MISKNNHNMGILENISEFCQTSGSSGSLMKYPENKDHLPDDDSDKRKCVEQISDTSKKKMQLSFSVDRLLSNDKYHHKDMDMQQTTEICCTTIQGCCSNFHCTVDNTTDVNQTNNNKIMKIIHGANPFDETHFGSISAQQIGYHQTDTTQSVIRPKPLRAISGKCSDNSASSKLPSLLKFHHEQPHYQMERNIGPIMNYFNIKSNNMHMDVPTISNLNLSTQQQCQQQYHQSSAQVLHVPLAFDNTVGIAPNYNGNTGKNLINSQVSISTNSKRKRSWSRAVFSNLQRKGLEIQFQQQKYITKPDRRKLAARLNLTDAQVKVWFQNRRMKWRHTRENLKSGQEKQMHHIDKNRTILADQLCYSSDSSSSPSENEEDNEIDVTG